jgi:FlaA1/EpsC-like NDP-sugar epimerase
MAGSAPFRVLIVGAGEAGRMIADGILADRRIAERYHLLGFVDDDTAKARQSGLPVFHGVDDLRALVQAHTVDTLFIAVPSAPAGFVGRIIDSVGGLAVRLRILPGLREIIDGEATWHSLRDVRPEDLLGREEVQFERERIASYYSDARVLVTGGGGSIGSEICRQLLSLPIHSVLAYGHGENSLYQLRSELEGDARFHTQIGDVRDPEKLERTILRFGITDVFHAAAHKHVPLMELFPDEAVKNNIYGSYVAARAAARTGVRRFLMISTDKAVQPSSVMGATKRIAERIVLGMNGGKTRYAVTRFGNVLGSRGSVLPLFIQQIERGGPITLTHPEVTRYFMSIREAARLVIKACSLDEGEIYVLDMGRPVNIHQLAKRLILLSGRLLEEIPITITGLRPGEKLHEELLNCHENLMAAPFERLFMASDGGKRMSANAVQEFIERMDPALNNPEPDTIRALLFEYV